MRCCTLAIFILLLVCGAAPTRGVTPDRGRNHQQVERTVAADPRVVVSACVVSGDLTIHGWDRKEVHARVSDGVQIELVRVDQTKTSVATELKLTAIHGRAGRGSQCLPIGDIELDVPRTASLKLQSNNGEVRVTEVARVAATAQSGSITLAKIHDEVSATTIGGEITVRDSTGSFKLHATGGSIEVRDLGPATAGDVLDASTVGGD
ncbi:MAG TPA: DUF4097 family beta strand repeat-containing protein, partial [Pyrinomonadaceae bacterium]|nr:DUF4097 family beta strand repeat-containing protein [Pyrinomonadaceae bacterium]